MPLSKTNRMPVRAALVDSAGPSALGFGLLLRQKRLDHFPQFVTNEFFSHAFSLPTTRFC
jgi:hypothetical protein